MSDHPPAAAKHHEEELLRRLRELATERDPVPEHVGAVARSALAARGRACLPTPPAEEDEPA